MIFFLRKNQDNQVTAFYKTNSFSDLYKVESDINLLDEDPLNFVIDTIDEKNKICTLAKKTFS